MQTPKETGENDRIKMDPPELFTWRNVMFWEPESKRLMRIKKDGNKEAATLLTKAKHFLSEGCIKKVGYNKFICKPLKGYNSTTYYIEMDMDGFFSCNCQGFNKKIQGGEPGFCSHCLAVKQWLYINDRPTN